jgi:membrane protein implicated in regulation of membrane protease activity
MATYRFVQFSGLDWRQRFGLAALAIVGVAVLAAFVLLSVGLAVVLVPVGAIAYLIARWRLRNMLNTARRNAAESPGDGRTIEVEYHVVGKDDGRQP